jgi:hypothetical protein
VTEAVLKRTNSGRARVAGDGTVLEAMSSRFALVKREALEAQWGESAEGSAAYEELERARAALGDRPNAKAVVVGEPEAGLLKLKNGRGSRPAYQAAVLVNEARVVLDAQVHSTSEQAALAEPLERLDGTQTQELLLDAGFNSYAVLECALEKDISLLCPEQAEDGQSQGKQPGLFALRDFRYVEDGDHYLCPAGAQLHRPPLCGQSAEGATGLRAVRELGLRYVRAPRPMYPGRGADDPAQRGPGAQGSLAPGDGPTPGQTGVRPAQGHGRTGVLDAARAPGPEPLPPPRLGRVRLEFRLHLTAYNLGRALAYARRGRLLALLLRLTRRLTTLCPPTRQWRGRLIGRCPAALSVRWTQAQPGLA